MKPFLYLFQILVLLLCIFMLVFNWVYKREMRRTEHIFGIVLPPFLHKILSFNIVLALATTAFILLFFFMEFMAHSSG